MGAESEVVFTIIGSLEFFNDDDSLRETMDIFSFSKLYYDHCEEKGLEPNEMLWYWRMDSGSGVGVASVVDIQSCLIVVTNISHF